MNTLEIAIHARVNELTASGDTDEAAQPVPVARPARKWWKFWN
jgi:hypothetical protein